MQKCRSLPQTILLIRAGALGDCLLMLPSAARLASAFSSSPYRCHGLPPRWGVGQWSCRCHIRSSVQECICCFAKKVSRVPGHLRSFLGTYDVILSYRPDPDGVFERNLGALGARLVLSQPPFPPPPPPKIHVADFALQLVARLGVPVPLPRQDYG